METKQCTASYGCGEHKPVTEFYASKQNADGYQNACKKCWNKRTGDNAKKREQHKTPTVYMMVCVPTNEFYIGSTTLTLRKRYWLHKTAAYVKHKQSNVYHAMRCWNDDKYWKMVPLQLLPGADTAILREAEQAHIDLMNPVLNTNNAIKEPS
jgi:hypothetical protein